MTGRASAPASAANLGPGFDVVALALDLRCRVRADADAAWSISEEGTTYVPDEADFVRRAIASATEGEFHLVIDNEVPRGRGLGSSAAVAAASIAAALRALGREPKSDDLFAVVAAADGHPDNAAAAVYGGLVAVGGDTVRRLSVHDGLSVVVGIPDAKLSTSHARDALSPTVDRAAVVRSLGRLALLLDGLRSGDPAALRGAGGDELHEAPRAHLSPVTGEMIAAALDAGALHAAWSGAGPSAIAFAADRDCQRVEAALAAVLGAGGRAMRLKIDFDGLR